MKDIVYLYINNFRYTKGDEVAKILNNHPLKGRVYRAIKTKEGFNIYVEPEDKNNQDMLGIHVEGFKSNYKGSIHDVTEINEENMYDFTLVDEDCDRLSKWILSGNKDLIELIESNNTKNISKGLMDKLKDIGMTEEDGEDEDEDDFNIDFDVDDSDLAMIREYSDDQEDDMVSDCKILDTIDSIRKNEADSIKAIEEVLTHISSTYKDKYEDTGINLTKTLIYSQKYGAGINIFNSIKYLQRYITEGYEKSSNKADLYKAIHYLIFEITRLNKHQK